jgi:mycothiol synthase
VIVRVGTDEFDSGPHEDVRALAAAADQADHVDTLNEQARLHLKNHGLDGARLWLAREDGEAAGFALLRGDQLDLVVRPDLRRRRIGTALATAALDGRAGVEAWSHADHPAAAALAERFGVPRTRELLVMSRPTEQPLPATTIPPGVRVRTFRPDDEAALLRINATAFAHHPEQGGMSAADFHARTREPWFDPEGLFLAVDADDTVLGFHWTKVHRDEDPAYGEVYVVAVDPRRAGGGIGKALTSAGLAHLADIGVGEVILYVEGDNPAAIAVYRGQGFTVSRTEAQYRGTPRHRAGGRSGQR